MKKLDVSSTQYRENQKIELKKWMGEKVTRLRKQKKLTQLDIANALGLSRVSVTNIETGLQSLNPDNILKLSKLLGCRIEELFPDEDEYSVNIIIETSAQERRRMAKITKLELQLQELKNRE